MAYQFKPANTQEIVNRIETDLKTRLGINSALLERGVLHTLARALADNVFLLHGHAEFMTNQAIPLTAIDEYLDKWCSIYAINRKPATFATGTATFTGNNGSVIPSGTFIITTQDTLQYQTTANATISLGTATAPVIAIAAGANYNKSPAVPGTLSFSLPGVNSNATITATNGTNEETDEELRGRLLFRLQQPPIGGAVTDYERWAKEVPGITRAYIFANFMSQTNKVGVAPIQDNDPISIIPDAMKIAEVQSYIDAPYRRPITAEVVVFALTPISVDFNIQLSPNTSEVQDAVKEELKDLLSREGNPSGTILISQINEAISIAAGEVDHVLVSPISNITLLADEIAILGNVTFNPIP